MLNKLKSIFCRHLFVVYDVNKVYLSFGDKNQNRESKEYLMKCKFCQKEQSIIKKWKVIE